MEIIVKIDGFHRKFYTSDIKLVEGDRPFVGSHSRAKPTRRPPLTTSNSLALATQRMADGRSL
jgi:hypothetical protein